MDIDVEEAAARIEKFLRQQFVYFQRDGAILGMSGGLDSAVVASLLTRALGPDRVLAVLLPERDSSPQSKIDALKEIDRLGIYHREIDLTPILSALGIYGLLPLRLLGVRRLRERVVEWQRHAIEESLGEPVFARGLLGTRGVGKNKRLIDSGYAYIRAKHRARLMVLYYLAEQENRLVVGTTNKSEAMTGFTVKWGDNVADVEPILPLYKTQVRRLAAYLGVTEDVIRKAPSPDLLPGILDEPALGMSYETLDRILEGLELGWDPDRIAAEAAAPADQIRQVEEMVRRSLHLRQLPAYPQLD
jgi:NAD+ synthase